MGHRWIWRWRKPEWRFSDLIENLHAVFLNHKAMKYFSGGKATLRLSKVALCFSHLAGHCFPSFLKLELADWVSLPSSWPINHRHMWLIIFLLRHICTVGQPHALCIVFLATLPECAICCNRRTCFPVLCMWGVSTEGLQPEQEYTEPLREEARQVQKSQSLWWVLLQWKPLLNRKLDFFKKHLIATLIH